MDLTPALTPGTAEQETTGLIIDHVAGRVSVTANDFDDLYRREYPTMVVNASRDAPRKRIFRRSRRHVIELVDAGEHSPDDYLLDALEQLAPRRRAAVVLRYYLDLPEGAAAVPGCDRVEAAGPDASGNR